MTLYQAGLFPKAVYKFFMIFSLPYLLSISEDLRVKASGLLSELGINDIKDFAIEVMKRYSEELEDISLAATKVRGV